MSGTRGISPIIGTVILIAIVMLLVSILFTGVFNLADTGSAAPQVHFDTSPADPYPGIVLAHQSGDALDTDRLTLTGGVLVTGFGETVTAGDTAVVIPTDETITVRWQQDDTSYTLFEHDPDISPYTDYSINQSGDVDIAEDTTIDGGIRSQTGEIDADENTSIKGAVVAVDDIDIDDHGTVYGPVNSTATAEGDLEIGSATVVYGAVTAADGEVDTGENATIYGDVIAANSDIELDQNTTVYGDVQASDSVDLGDHTVVHGTVSAPSLECGENVTINGESCNA